MTNPVITTTGLKDRPSLTSAAPIAQWAIATGSPDIIQAAYNPAITALVDGLILGVRAIADNATATPVFSPDGITAHTITKSGGGGLADGDIVEDGEALLRFNETDSVWELLNPATSSGGGGSSGTDFAMIESDVAGNNDANAQPWLPSGDGDFAVEVGTYKFEGQLFLSRDSGGTTSHTTGTLFGGTAAIAAIFGMSEAKTGDSFSSLGAWNGLPFVVATISVIKAASTSATEQVLIKIKGVVEFAGAGTFIPQFKYSAAPGQVPQRKAGSWFSMEKVA